MTSAMSTVWPFEPSASALEQFITLISESETGREKNKTKQKNPHHTFLK